MCAEAPNDPAEASKIHSRGEAPDNPSDAAPAKTKVDNLLEALYSRIDKMETKYKVANENGLFAEQSDLETLARTKLGEAFAYSLREKLTPAEYADALTALSLAQTAYNTAVEKVGLRKRLFYVYGIPNAIYLLMIFGLLVWFTLRPPVTLTGLPVFLTIPKKIILAGVLGSILRGTIKLWNDVDTRVYRKIWGTWYLLAPVMGALLGGIVYLAFYVGIVSSTSAPITNPSLAILVAILAGYNWEWAQQVLSNAVAVFKVTGAESK